MIVAAGRLEELPPGRARVVSAGGRQVAVFNVAGRLVAYANRCPHAGGPLGEGVVRDGVLTCPWHWWRYELASGRCLHAPGVRLERFQVEVRDGEVRVEIPPADPEPSMRELLLRHAREWSAAREREASG